MQLIIILGAVLVLICMWYVVSVNSIRALKLKVDEAESGIDVALTKRYDVLTKQLEVVKAYAAHESNTIMESIKLRIGMTMQERIEASSKMDRINDSLKAVAESYPELRSNENYKALQKSIDDVEEHLQAARRLYNANVTSYNTKIVMFPTSIVAGMIGATSRELFKVEEYKRNDVEMKF